LACLSRALERVRVVLVVLRGRGRHRRIAAHRVVRPALSFRPSPEVWGARVVAVRSHRRKRHTPHPQAPWEPMDVLVRPYVACLGGDVHATAQAGPFGGERRW
jgi:hypothetical protein